jgi:hypothetical protein
MYKQHIFLTQNKSDFLTPVNNEVQFDMFDPNSKSQVAGADKIAKFARHLFTL